MADRQEIVERLRELVECERCEGPDPILSIEEAAEHG